MVKDLGGGMMLNQIRKDKLWVRSEREDQTN